MKTKGSFVVNVNREVW